VYFLSAKSILKQAYTIPVSELLVGIATSTHRGMLSPTLSVTPLGHVDQLHKTSISKQDCYARALTIIGHLPRFLILNELNTKNSIASKNWTLNAAATRKKSTAA